MIWEAILLGTFVWLGLTKVADAIDDFRKAMK